MILYCTAPWRTTISTPPTPLLPLLILSSTISSLLFRCSRCEVFDFRSLEVLVLDEADTLLAMGFRENISQILAFLPKQRRYACVG
jgi:DEAD/DEAH box helicase